MQTQVAGIWADSPHGRLPARCDAHGASADRETDQTERMLQARVYPPPGRGVGSAQVNVFLDIAFVLA